MDDPLFLTVVQVYVKNVSYVTTISIPCHSLMLLLHTTIHTITHTHTHTTLMFSVIHKSCFLES